MEAETAVALRIRAVRDRLGLTQSVMAGKLGISVQSFSRYERGEREVPASVLSGLAELGVSPLWLLLGDGAMFAASNMASLDVHLLLNRIEGELDAGTRNEDQRRELERIALDQGAPDAERSRADMLLAVGFGDTAAEVRRDARASDFGKRLNESREVWQALVSEVAYSPPEGVAMALRDAMVTDGLTAETLRQILTMMKREFSS